MNIFISHSSVEAKTAEELCKVIEAGENTCFIAPRDIRSGCEYAEEIANGIDRSDAVLLLLSRASNNSPHVLREIERAVTKSIPVLVYKLEEVELTKSMEYFLMTHQWMEAGKDSYTDVAACISRLTLPKETGRAPEGKTVADGMKKRRIPLPAAAAVILLLIIAAATIGILLSDRDGEMFVILKTKFSVAFTHSTP